MLLLLLLLQVSVTVLTHRGHDIMNEAKRRASEKVRFELGGGDQPETSMDHIMTYHVIMGINSVLLRSGIGSESGSGSGNSNPRVVSLPRNSAKIDRDQNLVSYLYVVQTYVIVSHRGAFI